MSISLTNSKDLIVNSLSLIVGNEIKDITEIFSSGTSENIQSELDLKANLSFVNTELNNIYM